MEEKYAMNMDSVENEAPKEAGWEKGDKLGTGIGL